MEIKYYAIIKPKKDLGASPEYLPDFMKKIVVIEIDTGKVVAEYDYDPEIVEQLWANGIVVINDKEMKKREVDPYIIEYKI